MNHIEYLLGIHVSCKQPVPEITMTLYNQLECYDVVYCGLTKNESRLHWPMVLQQVVSDTS